MENEDNSQIINEIMNEENPGKLSLNQDVSYYRWTSTYQITVTIISILICFGNIALGIIAWFILWSLEKKVKVSPLDGSIAFEVPKNEWREYMNAHNISAGNQYKKQSVAKFNHDALNQKKLEILAQQKQADNEEYERILATFKQNEALKAGRYYFDPQQEQILSAKTFVDDNYVVYDFSDIVSYTPIEEGYNKTKKHGITRAVVGGAIAGGAGAIVGAVTGGKNFEYIKKLGVIITFNNNENIELIFMKGEAKKGGFVANAYYKDFRKVCGILDGVLTKNNNQQLQMMQQETINSSDSFSAADEIAKFKSLLDDGVITQAEFDAKKQQLLDL